MSTATSHPSQIYNKTLINIYRFFMKIKSNSARYIFFCKDWMKNYEGVSDFIFYWVCPM